MADRGLCTASGPVPLVGVDVRVEVRDAAARLVMSQRFRNDESHPIEAAYKFPLDEGAAVCGFEVILDGRRIDGRVEEREKAFAAYDDAMADGHGAYLLEEERPDIFTLSVGAVPPGAEVVVRITTVAELSMEGDAIRLTVPTTISPRYAPVTDRQGVGMTEAERVSPPFAPEVPYGLQLTAEIELGGGVRGVASPTDAIDVRMVDGRATVRLSGRHTVMDHDVVLLIEPARPHESSLLLERGADGHTYAQLSLRPRFSSARVATEVIFLVDRSGSMQGTSIDEARNALQLCLRSLGAGTYVNIIGFGDTFAPLFPESRPYDEESLTAAARHIESMDADMGGTELLPALEWVFAQSVRASVPRQLIVLTDGQVSNTDAVTALVRAHAGHTRLFSFGIGAGASHALVKGMARAGAGAAEFIAPGERIEAKVLRQLRRVLAPGLTNVQLDWGGLPVTQAPHDVPPIFSDGRLVVFGRVESPERATVRLTGDVPGGALRVETSFDPADVRDGGLLATLWARAAIRDLEEGSSAMHVRRGSAQPRAHRRSLEADQRVRDEIVRLGTAFSLLTRETSFVAVETRDAPAHGEIVLRRVPVAVTDGWHGFRRSRLSRQGAIRAFHTTGEFLAAPAFIARESPVGGASNFDDILPCAAPMLTGAMPGRAARAGSPRALRPMDRLITLQRADGSWLLDDTFAKALGTKRSRLERALKDVLRTHTSMDAGEETRRAFATAVALRWLETKAGAMRDEWTLLAEKATEWLDRTPPGAAFWRAAGVAGLDGSGRWLSIF